MSDLLATLLGSLGAALLLGAFHVTSRGLRAAGERPVALANLAGSLLLVLNTAHFEAWPPLVVNAVWALVAVQTLLRPPQPAG